MAEKTDGLSPECHDDLNRPTVSYPGGKEAREKRISELRVLYAEDPKALQEIDVYDDNTEYHNKFHEFVEALKSKDKQKISDLTNWFKTNYPDIK